MFAICYNNLVICTLQKSKYEKQEYGNRRNNFRTN